MRNPNCFIEKDGQIVINGAENYIIKGDYIYEAHNPDEPIKDLLDLYFKDELEARAFFEAFNIYPDTNDNMTYMLEPGLSDSNELYAHIVNVKYPESEKVVLLKNVGHADKDKRELYTPVPLTKFEIYDKGNEYLHEDFIPDHPFSGDYKEVTDSIIVYPKYLNPDENSSTAVMVQDVIKYSHVKGSKESVPMTDTVKHIIDADHIFWLADYQFEDMAAVMNAEQAFIATDKDNVSSVMTYRENITKTSDEDCNVSVLRVTVSKDKDFADDFMVFGYIPSWYTDRTFIDLYEPHQLDPDMLQNRFGLFNA
jgi:hypothetical protein